MSRGSTARLFVTVDPPLAAREELAEWARMVAASVRAAGGSPGALRLLDAELLHLTLCFLGSRPVGEIEDLAGAVESCSEHTCELSVGAPLWLPLRRPHALAVEIHDRSGELARVQQRVSRALSSVSRWEPERRRFRPHITLARVRRTIGRGVAGSRRRGSDGASVARPGHELALPTTPRLDFLAQEIVLYRSWLAAEGATYEALASGGLTPAVR
jgi:2'-5' RNA ligase